MEENMISPGEINSIAYLNKKRKLQAELLGMPFPKHVCWGQRLDHNPSFDSNIEPKMVGSSIFATSGESDPDCASNSYSFRDDADSSMSSHDDAKIYMSYKKRRACVEHGTSSTCADGSSSQTGLCSSESRKLTNSVSSKSESSSICEDPDCLHHDTDCLHHDNGFRLPYSYEDQLLEFGAHADCGFSEYQNNGVGPCTHKELEDLLNSKGIDASSNVLSSGRWSVNQENQETTKTLTIDKEFEQYFSTLML